MNLKEKDAGIVATTGNNVEVTAVFSKDGTFNGGICTNVYDAEYANVYVQV